MKININKKNIIQAFIVITAFICIFGYVFINNIKILKAENMRTITVHYILNHPTLSELPADFPKDFCQEQVIEFDSTNPIYLSPNEKDFWEYNFGNDNYDWSYDSHGDTRNPARSYNADGYYFSGWYTQPDAQGDWEVFQYIDDSVTDFYFYGYWTSAADQSVKFKYNIYLSTQDVNGNWSEYEEVNYNILENFYKYSNNASRINSSHFPTDNPFIGSDEYYDLADTEIIYNSSNIIGTGQHNLSSDEVEEFDNQILLISDNTDPNLCIPKYCIFGLGLRSEDEYYTSTMDYSGLDETIESLDDNGCLTQGTFAKYHNWNNEIYYEWSTGDLREYEDPYSYDGDIYEGFGYDPSLSTVEFTPNSDEQAVIVNLYLKAGYYQDPRSIALQNYCTLTVDSNLPDGYTVSDFKDDDGNHPDYVDNSFGDFLVHKNTDLVNYYISGSCPYSINIQYVSDLDEYGEVIDELYLSFPTYDDHLWLKNKEYYLCGFNTEPDGSGNNIILIDDTIMVENGSQIYHIDTDFEITENTTIYAIWQPFTYYISFYDHNPYDLGRDGSSFEYDDYKVKYNGEYFDHFYDSDFWGETHVGEPYTNAFGLDDQLNLPELSLVGYNFIGWDVTDGEYIYNNDYNNQLIKYIGKATTLRNKYSWEDDPYSGDNGRQYIMLTPHFEKKHEGNIKFNIYTKQGNNYVLYNDEMIFDYDNLTQTIDLPYTFETNSDTSESITVTINNNTELGWSYSDIPLFYDDEFGSHAVNMGLLSTSTDYLQNWIFYVDEDSQNIIKITDNNNNSFTDLINFNRTNVVSTPNEDQDMILNLYLDLPADTTTPYSIEYDLNDISDYYDVTINTCPISAFCGESVTIPKPTLKGYTFIGWKVNDTTQIINQNDGIYTDLASAGETVTLTAQWQPWTINVAFAINLNLGGYYNTNNIYNYKYMSPLIPSNNSTYPYQMLTYNDGQGYAYKYGTVTIDVNKNISEYTDLLSEYNEISNMIVPGTEFNGFYVVPYANHLFDNKTYYDISYTNNIVIDDADNCILNNLPANYEITSSSLIYLIPKWDCNFYTKVNMHYAVQDENGNWEDYVDAEEYYKYNTVERFVQSDTIPETPSAVLDNTNNIVSIYDSIYMNIPSSTLQNASSPYMNNIGVCIGNLFFVSDMNKSNRNVQVQLNNNYKNQSLSQFNYTLSLMYGGNTGNTFGYLESYNYTYGWSDTPATRNYTSIDYNRSSITFVDGNDDYNAIIDLYIKIPREKKELYVLFLSDTTNYPNIYYNDEKMYIDGERVLPPSSNNYNYQNTNSINLLNENNVSQTYNGYYFVNIHPIIYKGGSVTFSIETTSNYHITMAHGEPTSVNDFAEVNSMTLTWNDVSSSPWVYVRKMPHISTPFTINLDGTVININDIIYNSSHINKLVVDDETIWEKTCDVCGQAM